MLKIGEVIDGKYKILNQIGKGGMSVVYLAMNESVNKSWAIKEVRKDSQNDASINSIGIKAEINLLKNCRHPNMPEIIDVIENEDNYLIVMDYIEGVTLKKLLDEYGAQPQELVIKWGKQLCDVLGYLHKKNIIYRDTKPANIMRKPDGNVELFDFGTVREFKGMKMEDTIALGTVGYAAPEQYEKTSESDARTDIYSLGATLYHLVTGNYPTVSGFAQGIRASNMMLSEGLEQIIRKCTEHDADKRYQNCAELMYDLEHCDESDKKYRKKQWRKMIAFSSMVCLSLAGVATGITGNKLVLAKTEEQYDSVLERAESSTMDEKHDLYIDAIKIKPGDKEAYLELINKIYKDDKIFSRTEMNEIEEVMLTYGKPLKSDELGYSDVCYNIGILYWYYCDETMEEDNSRFDAVCTYFGKVSKRDSNKDLAEIFYNMANFRRNIQNSITESTDRGEYMEYWKNIDKLIEAILNKGVNDNLKLNSCKMILNAIEGYTEEFKTDGVTKDQMNICLDNVEIISGSVQDDKTEDIVQIKKYIESRLEYVNRKIDTVYMED